MSKENRYTSNVYQETIKGKKKPSPRPMNFVYKLKDENGNEYELKIY